LLAIGIIEKIAFDTAHFSSLLRSRLLDTDAIMSSPTSMELMPYVHPGMFFLNPGFWTGLAITAIFLAGAIQLRKSRGPI